MGYRIEQRSGGFAVYPVEPARVRITTFTPKGGVQARSEPVDRVIPGYDASTFVAHYSGADVWDTDINCGAQRWRGDKTTREIKKALRSCGFSKGSIEATVASARAGCLKKERSS